MSSIHVLTRKWGSPICHALQTVQNTHVLLTVTLIHRQQTIYWIFTQTN